MSADNWAQCPRCTTRAKKNAETLMAQAQAAYGHIPPDEYAAKLAEASAAAVLPGNVRTFREDYEIYGADEGTVVVEYSGYCETCGLSLSFRENHPIPGVDGDGAS